MKMKAKLLLTLLILIVFGILISIVLVKYYPTQNSIISNEVEKPHFPKAVQSTNTTPQALDVPWADSKNWIKPEHNPILSPTEPWEDKNVLEPTVLYEEGVFKMWYCGGEKCALGYATSQDGVNWDKHENNPIFGKGKGGEDGTVRQNNVLKHEGIYYLFYVTDSKDMYVATSKNGVDFKKYSKSILNHDPDSWDINMANNFQWVDESGNWFMIYESQFNDGYALWNMGLAYGDSPFKWHKYGDKPLDSIQKGNGMFGGPWVVKINNIYYLFHHASVIQDNLPTDIYIHYSTDLVNWYRDDKWPLVTRTQPHWELDQTADPSIVEANGKTYLYYDGNDNTLETGYRAWIGYVYYNGLISNSHAK